MGASKKTSTENSVNYMIVKDPNKAEKDIVNMSEAFLDRFLAPMSSTSSWSILQKKIFILMVSQLNLSKHHNVVILDNRSVMKELGWNYSKENFSKVGFKLRDELDEMSLAKLRLQDAITKKWYSGYLIFEAEGDPNFTKITLNEKFLNHFTDLYYMASKYKQAYFGVMKPDVLELKNDYAHRLLYDLRMQFKVSNHPVTKEITYLIPDLLGLLGIDENEYLKKSNPLKNSTAENNDDEIKTKFNYYGFERRVLDVIIENINSSEQIRFNPNSKGEYYVKVKSGRRIVGYRFNVTVNDINTIKSNMESLIKFAKKQGFYVEFEPEWVNSFPDENWHGSWNIKERDVIDTEFSDISEDENFQELDLPCCFADYDQMRPIEKECPDTLNSHEEH